MDTNCFARGMCSNWIYCYKRRLVECYFVYNIKPRANGRSIVGHTGRKNGFAQICSLQICSKFVKTED